MKEIIKKNLVLLEDLGMIYPKENSKYKKRYGLYKCFCGNEFKAQMPDIKKGSTSSCGCYRRYKTAETNTNNKATHGLSNHRLYHVWSKMIDRCINKNNKRYKDYGGRGISVCEEWHDINNFLADMYPTFIEGLSIDRINTHGNYEPSNCRWATKGIQARNTRKIMTTNTSGCRGVHFCETLNKWVAQITINNNKKHLGCFNTILEAAKAYDKYVTDNNLEHTLNFK